MKQFALILALVLGLPAAASAADFVWAKEAVDATRFVEADSKVVGKLTPDQKAEVLFRSTDKVRVRVGATFGWVPVSKVTATNPAGDTDTTYEE